MERKTIRVSDSLNNKDLKVVTIEENYGLYTVSTQYRGFVKNGLLEQTVPSRTRVICNTTKMFFDCTDKEVDDCVSSILKIRKYIAESPNRIMIGRGCATVNGEYKYETYHSMVWIYLGVYRCSYGQTEGKGVAIWTHENKIHIEETDSLDIAVDTWKKHISTTERIIVGSEVGRNLTIKETNNGSHRILGDWLMRRA